MHALWRGVLIQLAGEAWSGRRVLVAGGAGFIGAAICRRLARLGADVRTVVRPGADVWRLNAVGGVTVHEVDLGDPAAVRVVRKAGPEWVFDAAAEGGHFEAVDSGAVLARHLRALDHLLQGARAAGTSRMVHLGSATEYGSAAGLVEESAPCRPSTPRGCIKYASTRHCLQLARDLDLEAVVLRPFHVYGPAEQAHRLVPTAISAALAGRPLAITAADPARDYVYVEDVVDACLLAMATPGAAGQIFNVGTGVATSNRQLLAAVELAAGVPTALAAEAFPPRPTDSERRVADTRKARSRLAWTARTGLQAGLAATIVWARAPQAAPLHA